MGKRKTVKEWRDEISRAKSDARTREQQRIYTALEAAIRRHFGISSRKVLNKAQRALLAAADPSPHLDIRSANDLFKALYRPGSLRPYARG